jgi:hypothetical protein
MRTDRHQPEAPGRGQAALAHLLVPLQQLAWLDFLRDAAFGGVCVANDRRVKIGPC